MGRILFGLFLIQILRTPIDAKITDCSEAETWIFTTEDADQEKVESFGEKGVRCISAAKDEKGLDFNLL